MAIIRNLFGESVWQSLIVGRQDSSAGSSVSQVVRPSAARPAGDYVPTFSFGEKCPWCASCPDCEVCDGDTCSWSGYDIDFPIKYFHYPNLAEFINDVRRQGWL